MNRKKIVLVLAVLSGTILHGGTVRAAAIANFTDGNGTTSGDSFVGVAGSGWAGPWANALGNAPIATNTVVNTTPLGTGNNYLSMSMTGSATNASSTQNVYRTFATGAVDGNGDTLFSRSGSKKYRLEIPRLYNARLLSRDAFQFQEQIHGWPDIPSRCFFSFYV